MFSALVLFFGFANGILEGEFDPNAINGFGSGSFNPNAGISTIAPPSISGGNGEGSGFNPNAGLASTIAPPVPNGFTGWSGSGNFNPNSGNLQATTSSPDGSGGFGNWNWGTASRRSATTKSPFGNFQDNFWGFGSGSGSFYPKGRSTTRAPHTPAPTTTTTTTTTTTSTTIHPTTVTLRPKMFGRKTTPLPKGSRKANKIKIARARRFAKTRHIGKLAPAIQPMDYLSGIVG